MKCELAEGGQYIIVTFDRAMTAALGRQLVKDIVAFSEKHQLKKFLFDMRNAVNVDHVFANYEFAHRDLSDSGFPLDSYTAVLVHPDDHSHDFITVAFNKFGYHVRLFTEKDMAVSWLDIKGDDTRPVSEKQ